MMTGIGSDRLAEAYVDGIQHRFDASCLSRSLIAARSTGHRQSVVSHGRRLKKRSQARLRAQAKYRYLFSPALVGLLLLSSLFATLHQGAHIQYFTSISIHMLEIGRKGQCSIVLFPSSLSASNSISNSHFSILRRHSIFCLPAPTTNRVLGNSTTRVCDQPPQQT